MYSNYCSLSGRIRFCLDSMVEVTMWSLSVFDRIVVVSFCDAVGVWEF